MAAKTNVSSVRRSSRSPTILLMQWSVTVGLLTDLAQEISRASVSARRGSPFKVATYHQSLRRNLFPVIGGRFRIGSIKSRQR
jgi:hypothetical protein